MNMEEGRENIDIVSLFCLFVFFQIENRSPEHTELGKGNSVLPCRPNDCGPFIGFINGNDVAVFSPAHRETPRKRTKSSNSPGLGM